MLIPVLTEPNYRSYIWAQQTLESIAQEAAKRKYRTVTLDSESYESVEYDRLFGDERRMLIVIGTSVSWMPKALAFFTSRKIESIFISFDPSEVSLPTGMVRMDYVGATDHLLSYLEACGKKRIAMYGFNPNSSADNIKLRFYRSRYCGTPETVQDNIFMNLADLKACYSQARPKLRAFDAVICANDIVAVSLISMLKQDGIRVPEDLYVAAYGNSVIAEKTVPALTTATLDHREMGKQAVHLFSYLTKMPSAASVSVRVKSKLIIRDSTGMQPDLSPDRTDLLMRQGAGEGVNFYSDPEAEMLLRAETLLGAADDADNELMECLVRGMPMESLEQKLFLTTSALQYRKKRLMSAAGCQHTPEFVDFLQFCREKGIL